MGSGGRDLCSGNNSSSYPRTILIFCKWSNSSHICQSTKVGDPRKYSILQEFVFLVRRPRVAAVEPPDGGVLRRQVGRPGDEVGLTGGGRVAVGEDHAFSVVVVRHAIHAGGTHEDTLISLKFSAP